MRHHSRTFYLHLSERLSAKREDARITGLSIHPAGILSTSYRIRLARIHNRALDLLWCSY
jgi:hypothetical protein